MRLLLPLVLLGCQEFTVDKNEPVLDEPVPDPPECVFEAPPTSTVPYNPLCEPVEEPEGGFRPMVEWGGGSGKSCRGTPVVGDLDLDGEPEVIANFTGILPGARGEIVVMRGAGGRVKWRKDAGLGYGSSFALGDINGDGYPEIIAVRSTEVGFVGFAGKYALVAYDKDGTKLWQTDEFGNNDFDYATAPVISDMNHDGSPEIIAGRVIFNADGTFRGKGNKGRGSWGNLPGGLSEASISAVSDLDLDGQEEVIVGDARYDIDGNTIWHDPNQNDGIVGIANLDDDPEGEVVVVSYHRVRAQDTNGRVMWGPKELLNANIVSPPAIADIDADGYPEIVVAGGNQLAAFNHDGTILWSQTVQDESGASGASIFDFEGDGIPEVVYADEIQLMAFDGLTGARKFYSDEHASDTMMEYPVIADVDNDDHAEIVVCHANYGSAISVYGDEDSSWRPAREVWNQHAYSMTNVTDSLGIPVSVPPSFTTHNTWHAASSEVVGPTGQLGPVDVGAESLGVCEASCSLDGIELWARLTNSSTSEIPAGLVSLSLYATMSGSRILVDTEPTTSDVPAGETGGDVMFTVPTDVAFGATGWEIVADDLGGGVGTLTECAEANNTVTLSGPLCTAFDEE
jgi:hypothetical protein